MTRSSKAFVAVGALGLIVLVSLSIVASSGCVKKKSAAPNPSSVNLSRYLSSEEKVLEKLFVDVNKDGDKEIIFLSGKKWDIVSHPDFPSYKSVKIRILTWDGSKYTSSWEQKVVGERSVELVAEDINRDSIIEILSHQEMGNTSILYVVAWDGSSYRLLKPVGGNPYFKGFFGLKGAEVKDADNDGVKEIYGYYGPVGSKADIYKWDGKNYKFFKTVSSPLDNSQEY